MTMPVALAKAQVIGCSNRNPTMSGRMAMSKSSGVSENVRAAYLSIQLIKQLTKIVAGAGKTIMAYVNTVMLTS